MVPFSVFRKNESLRGGFIDKQLKRLLVEMLTNEEKFMQNVADCLEGHPEGRKWLYGFILPITPKVKNSTAKKIKLSPEALNVTSLSLKDDKQLCSQAEYQLSTIFDPLWKKICIEVGRMMGPFAVVKLGVCQLGDLSSENSTLDLYCPTEETGAFAQQCGFVILGEIQQYL